jgi:hypothetical protein
MIAAAIVGPHQRLIVVSSTPTTSGPIEANVATSCLSMMWLMSKPDYHVLNRVVVRND